MKRNVPLIIDGIEIPPAWMCEVIARQKREHQEQLTLRAPFNAGGGKFSKPCGICQRFDCRGHWREVSWPRT